MKKYFFSLLFFLVTSAHATSSVDEQLQDAGIIDKDYRYVSEELATEFFREMSNEVASSLPQKNNNYLETTTSFFTPHYAKISYRFLIPMTDEEKEMAKKELTSTESLEELCNDSFNHKYLWANNYNITYTYMDIDYKKIVDVDINVPICVLM